MSDSYAVDERNRMLFSGSMDIDGGHKQAKRCSLVQHECFFDLCR